MEVASPTATEVTELARFLGTVFHGKVVQARGERRHTGRARVELTQLIEIFLRGATSPK